MRTLLFFPSVNFKLIAAEVFPWALIYSLLKAKKVSNYFVFIIYIFAFSACYALFVNGADIVFEVVRSLAAYLNSLLVLFIVINVSDREFEKLSKTVVLVFAILLTVGVLQKLNAFYFFQPIMDIIMQRGQVADFGGGRGISLLSSEPSRAAVEITFIYCTIMEIKNVKAKARLFFDIAMLLFILLFIKSATGLLIYLAYLLCFYRLKLVLFFVIILPVAYLVSLGISVESVRALSLLDSIFNMHDYGKIYSFVMSSSGNRGVSILGSYIYGTLNPFGGGIGAWHSSSITAMSLTGIDASSLAYFRQTNSGIFSSVRPPSYIASLMLDVGVIGTFLIISSIYKFIKVKACNCEDFPFAFTSFFVMYLFLISSVGNPIPFICFALAVRGRIGKIRQEL